MSTDDEKELKPHQVRYQKHKAYYLAIQIINRLSKLVQKRQLNEAQRIKLEAAKLVVEEHRKVTGRKPRPAPQGKQKPSGKKPARPKVDRADFDSDEEYAEFLRERSHQWYLANKKKYQTVYKENKAKRNAALKKEQQRQFLEEFKRLYEE